MLRRRHVRVSSTSLQRRQAKMSGCSSCSSSTFSSSSAFSYSSTSSSSAFSSSFSTSPSASSTSSSAFSSSSFTSPSSQHPSPPPPPRVVVAVVAAAVNIHDCLYVCTDTCHLAEVTGWSFTFASWDPPKFLIRWETHRKRITAVSTTS